MRILAVTGTRADWGLLAPVLELIREDVRFDLRLMVTGQHLEPDSRSVQAIHEEGFVIDYQVDMQLGEDDGPASLADSMGRALSGTGSVLAEAQPDLVLVLGDRYEILAVASAAVLARVPLAHLCGGDLTEGAMDDAIRHAVSKLSALHFVSNEEAAARVRQLGEDPGRVHCVGSPGLDRIRLHEPLSRETFFRELGIAPRERNLLITFHPPTLSADAEAQCEVMLTALSSFPEVGMIFTGSNADPGGRVIDTAVREFAKRNDNAVFCASLGSRRYFAALAHVDAVVGNSSSGLYEAPSFAVPTVNIGDRQARRPRSASVIDCAADAGEIRSAIERAFELDCSGVVNPYGDGRAAERIVERLAAIECPERLIRKSFVDLPA